MKLKDIFARSHSVLWDTKNKKWLREESNDRDIQYALVFGDPGGDAYLDEYQTEDEFNKNLERYFIDGDNGCDFATVVYIIIKNGEKYRPKIS